MRKYKLKDFEFSIIPATWDKAQDLAAAGMVKALREVEPNFWVAKVEEEQTALEVEIILTPQRIKDFTCECWGEGRRLMCAHVAAALLKIRHFLEKKSSLKTAAAPKDKPNSKFTVATVLKEADPDRLQAFVREYARRDRDFALALKTWFADAVDIGHNPYLLVLDAAIPRSASHKPLRDAEFRRLRQTLDDLFTQIRDAADNGAYPKTLEIGSALLDRLAPLITLNEDNHKETLIFFSRETLGFLSGLPTHQLSPELQDRIWQYLFQWAENPHLPQELELDLIRILAAQTGMTGRAQDVFGLFENTHSPANDRILLLYLAGKAHTGTPEAAKKVLEWYEHEPNRIFTILRGLYYLRYWDAALEAGLHFLDKCSFKKNHRRELEDMLLYMAERSENRKAACILLRQRFLQYHNLDIYRRWKTAAADAWPEQFSLLVRELLQNRQFESLASILAEENDPERLQQSLAHCDDLAVIGKFAKWLDEDFISQKYLEILIPYLQNHFGKPASSHVRQTLGLLHGKKNGRVAQTVIQELIRIFPDHLYLAEDLHDLGAKPQKNKIL